MDTIDNTQVQPEVKHEYAGFWVRAAALLIDMAVLAFLFNEIHWRMRDNLNDYFTIHPETAERYIDMFRLHGTSKYELSSYIGYYFGIVISLLLQWFYYAGMESSPLKATIGKWAVGAYVTDMNGARISFGKATGRYFGKIVSGLILGIGYLMAGFSYDKQALHDQMAGCLVWRK